MLRGFLLQASKAFKVSQSFVQSHRVGSSNSGLYRLTMAATGTTGLAVVTVTAAPKSSESNAGKDATDATKSMRPAHHLNDTKSLFTNPWPSFVYVDFMLCLPLSFSRCFREHQ
jgi:hypothetical protein